jgi:hypothetical protein
MKGYQMYQPKFIKTQNRADLLSEGKDKTNQYFDWLKKNAARYNFIIEDGFSAKGRYFVIHGQNFYVYSEPKIIRKHILVNVRFILQQKKHDNEQKRFNDMHDEFVNSLSERQKFLYYYIHENSGLKG